MHKHLALQGKTLKAPAAYALKISLTMERAQGLEALVQGLGCVDFVNDEVDLGAELGSKGLLGHGEHVFMLGAELLDELPGGGRASLLCCIRRSPHRVPKDRHCDEDRATAQTAQARLTVRMMCFDASVLMRPRCGNAHILVKLDTDVLERHELCAHSPRRLDLWHVRVGLECAEADGLLLPSAA